MAGRALVAPRVGSGGSNPKLSFVHKGWTTVVAGQRPESRKSIPKFTGSSPGCAQARAAFCTCCPQVVHRLRLRPRPSGPSVTHSHRSLHGRLPLAGSVGVSDRGDVMVPVCLQGRYLKGEALVARGAQYEDL
jgi:hypothetical protein